PGAGPDADVDTASGRIERQTAALAADACGSFGSWTTVTTPDTVPTASCARYRYRVSDAAGNTATATGTAVVKRDATAPSTPTLSFSGLTSAYLSGGTVYFRQGAAGGFTVSASSADAESGVASTAFPALGAGWSESTGAYA